MTLQTGDSVAKEQTGMSAGPSGTLRTCRLALLSPLLISEPSLPTPQSRVWHLLGL